MTWVIPVLSSANFGEALYTSEERRQLPDAAALASLGCGNPTEVAELHEGEVVHDLGSSGGIDVILSAKRFESATPPRRARGGPAATRPARAAYPAR